MKLKFKFLVSPVNFVHMNPGFLQRGVEEVSPEAQGVVTRLVGQGTRPTGL